jgi:hypothetical protein
VCYGKARALPTELPPPVRDVVPKPKATLHFHRTRSSLKMDRYEGRIKHPDFSCRLAPERLLGFCAFLLLAWGSAAARTQLGQGLESPKAGEPNWNKKSPCPSITKEEVLGFSMQAGKSAALSPEVKQIKRITLRERDMHSHFGKVIDELSNAHQQHHCLTKAAGTPGCQKNTLDEGIEQSTHAKAGPQDFQFGKAENPELRTEEGFRLLLLDSNQRSSLEVEIEQSQRIELPGAGQDTDTGNGLPAFIETRWLDLEFELGAADSPKQQGTGVERAQASPKVSFESLHIRSDIQTKTTSALLPLITFLHSETLEGAKAKDGLSEFLKIVLDSTRLTDAGQSSHVCSSCMLVPIKRASCTRVGYEFSEC